MLTEHEISRSWRKLFREYQFDDKILAKAQTLIDELRPESPLRHRLTNELVEIKKIHAQHCS